MKWIFSWVFSHKLVTLLTIVVLFLLFSQTSIPIPLSKMETYPSYGGRSDSMMGIPQELSMKGDYGDSSLVPQSDFAPVPDLATRMVVQNSYLSLQVNDVSSSITQIKQHTNSVGGYMVNANVNNPDESADGNITVRIPTEKLDETLAYFRTLAVKVVTENLQGTDVTDQFVDNEERLRILEKNKARMEEIMLDATEISDISSIQQQIFNIQNQIDSIKGQQNYLEKTSKMALVTLYLSTDELALPYTPSQSWRPQLIFKEAIRSVLVNLQKLGTLGIWVGVYALILVPIGILFYFLKRTFLPKKTV